jgi:two-component system, OmpR family, sensor kinase
VKRFAPRGVRARLCLAFTLTAAVVALGGSLLFVHVVRVGLGNNLDNNLEARAQTIAGVLDGTGPVELPDPLLDAGTKVLGQDTVETFAVVRRPDGEILTATGAPAPHLALPPQLLDLQDGELARTTLQVGDQPYRVAALAVGRSDGVWLALAGTSRRANDEALHDLSNALLVAGPVLVILVAAGAWVLAGAALRPVERMRRDAAAHGGTGRERLAVPPTGDELARLAVTLNELLERLGSSLARQQDLVADAGHELRTPLAVLRTELELASRPGRSHDELKEAVEHAALEVDRLSQLAEDLLFLARADSSGPLVRPQPTDLAGVLHAAIRSARASADLAGVTLSVDVAPELTAVLDASAVRRAVDNMLSNAIEYAPGGPGRALVQLSAAYGSDLHTLTVSVEDTGPGFPPDFLPHAFDRFRRADPARTHNHGQRGAGLGLAVVREIAEAHGGRAGAGNVDGSGARVAITIPQPIPADLAPPQVGIRL